MDEEIILICDVLSCRFAYVEFADKDSVVTAMALDESLFRGRQIKVWQQPSLGNDSTTPDHTAVAGQRGLTAMCKHGD